MAAGPGFPNPIFLENLMIRALKPAPREVQVLGGGVDIVGRIIGVSPTTCRFSSNLFKPLGLEEC